MIPVKDHGLRAAEMKALFERRGEGWNFFKKANHKLVDIL